MTRAQTKSLMPVLVAWSEGRTIQVRDLTSPEWWVDFTSEHGPDLSSIRWEWRVKPTPREFWVVVGHDGTIHGASSCSAGTKMFAGCDIIHVREVVE